MEGSGFPELGFVMSSMLPTTAKERFVKTILTVINIILCTINIVVYFVSIYSKITKALKKIDGSGTPTTQAIKHALGYIQLTLAITVPVMSLTLFTILQSFIQQER